MICVVGHTPRYSHARRAGIFLWPKGLRWFPLRRLGRASFTIKSKGRTGAKDRQRLMTIERDYGMTKVC